MHAFPLLLIAALGQIASPQAVRTDGTPLFAPVLIRAVAPVDPSGGFLAWLNATRAAHRLPAVAWDPGLASDAATNCAMQARRGLGHFFLGRARRQNCGMGPFTAMPGLWMGDAPHRAALLDPSIRLVGLAGVGGFWTYCAR